MEVIHDKRITITNKELCEAIELWLYQEHGMKVEVPSFKTVNAFGGLILQEKFGIKVLDREENPNEQ